MLPKTNPTQTRSWQKLARHFEKIKDVEMRDLFAKDPDRFNRFSIRFNHILVDYSKNRVTEETLALLLALAGEVSLKDAIGQMFDGQKINEIENRAVLHIALRNPDNTPITVEGTDVMPQVNAVLKK
jgi:glucose-6-phosphate isomerase